MTERERRLRASRRPPIMVLSPAKRRENAMKIVRTGETQTWPLSLRFLSAPMFLNSFFLSATVTFVQGEAAPERRVISGAFFCW
jgi:hypothetical protein